MIHVLLMHKLECVRGKYRLVVLSKKAGSCLAQRLTDSGTASCSLRGLLNSVLLCCGVQYASLPEMISLAKLPLN